LPVEISCFENVNVVESEVGIIESTEDKEFILGDATGGMVGSFKRDITTALYLAPFNVIFHNLDCIDLIVRKHFAIFFNSRINTTKHDGHTTHASNSLPRTGIRHLAGRIQ